MRPFRCLRAVATVMEKSWYFKNFKKFRTGIPGKVMEFRLKHGTFCAANWLILANFDPNFVTPEISVNQVKKCWPICWGGGLKS